MDYTDRIIPTHRGITTYLDDLLGKKYQIPTFQRNVVWEKENVKKLWDSVYKFYPLGSILIWKTDIKLQNHREIGGHKITDETDKDEYQYVLDGQQRTTSLLTSIHGGTIVNQPGFNPTIYIDLSITNQSETDDESYKDRFLFWDEIDDQEGKLKKNTGKMKKFNRGIIVKLMDVKQNFNKIEKQIVNDKEGDYSDYDHPIRTQLRKMKEILDNYRISFIELKGIQVSEVCQIFERINQAGKPLNIFDIIVAKTFRPEKKTKKEDGIEIKPGFYLREIIEEFRKTNESLFLKNVDDLTYLQILAILINKKNPKLVNITDRYLNEINAEDIEQIWDDAKKAILKTFDFFENHLHLKGPQLIPFRYFYLTIARYFYENLNPDYSLLKKYFWFNSFHNEDLLTNTTQLFEHISFLENTHNFNRFLIDKNKLRISSYSSKGRLSRAILSLYANQDPKDWKNPDRSVLVEVYYELTDRPNLHHVFPVEYLEENPGINKLDVNSLMNIVYLPQITNLNISKKNPIKYIKEYNCPEFERIIKKDLIDNKIIDWSQSDQMPENALDQFIEQRIDNILTILKEKIGSSNFEIIDTKE